MYRSKSPKKFACGGLIWGLGSASAQRFHEPHKSEFQFTMPLAAIFIFIALTQNCGPPETSDVWLTHLELEFGAHISCVSSSLSSIPQIVQITYTHTKPYYEILVQFACQCANAYSQKQSSGGIFSV